MELTELIRAMGARVTGSFTSAPPQITGLAYRSSAVQPGELFFCLPGVKTDGHRYAVEAVSRGAAALVVERPLPIPVPQCLVPESRRALAQAARAFWGEPAQELGLIGVTGTNGKTTTCYLIGSLLQESASPAAFSTTVVTQVGTEARNSRMTTPESADLYRFMREALDRGAPWAAIEVSSHGLAMGRVDPAEFDLAVVTNVTRDHLDFHQTFADYWAAKARLVHLLHPERKGDRPKGAVLNRDDAHAFRMATASKVPVLTYGVDPASDIRASEVELSLDGSRFQLHLPGAAPEPVHLPNLGAHNVSNALAAAAIGHLLGLSAARIARALGGASGVPGRLERIEEGQPFAVLVDYAHNPDGLRKVVEFRPAGSGRLILVFGAEGGKDRGKRAMMGEIARQADLVIITLDNMWGEAPEAVTAQIAAGLGQKEHLIILDRREALAEAIRAAEPGDLVVVAGKGHETAIVGPDGVRPFDDRAVLREILREQMRL
jgi:UDP-N-acetylmuramoyl-L-alanyl-D-glutamate--2,6-diaminopimelate ligase